MLKTHICPNEKIVAFFDFEHQPCRDRRPRRSAIMDDALLTDRPGGRSLQILHLFRETHNRLDVGQEYKRYIFVPKTGVVKPKGIF